MASLVVCTIMGYIWKCNLNPDKSIGFQTMQSQKVKPITQATVQQQLLQAVSNMNKVRKYFPIF